MHCEMLLNMMQSSLNDSETTFRVRVWQGGRWGMSQDLLVYLTGCRFTSSKHPLPFLLDSRLLKYTSNHPPPITFPTTALLLVKRN